MAPAPDLILTVGDRQKALRATLRLREADGSLTLAPLTDVTLRMVSALAAPGDPPKINDAPCTIESPGVAVYQWTAADVDTAGRYYFWFQDQSGVLVQTWPEDGRTRLIEFVPAA